MAFQNVAAKRRRRTARRLYEYLKELDLLDNLREVSKATDVDVEILKTLGDPKATPKLETLERIAAYVEEKIRGSAEKSAG